MKYRAACSSPARPRLAARVRACLRAGGLALVVAASLSACASAITPGTVGPDLGPDVMRKDFGFMPVPDTGGSDLAGSPDLSTADGSAGDGPGQLDGSAGDGAPDAPVPDGSFQLDLGGRDTATDRPGQDVQLADRVTQSCEPLDPGSCPPDRTCIHDTATTGTCSAFGTRGELDECDFAFSNGDCARNLVCLSDSGPNPPPPQCLAYCDPAAQTDPCSPETLCVGTLVGVDENVLRVCLPITNCDIFAPPAPCNAGRPCCSAGERCEPISEENGVLKSECLPGGSGGINASCADPQDPHLDDPSLCQAGFLCISVGSLNRCSTDADCTSPEICRGGTCSRPSTCRPICDPTAQRRVVCPTGAGTCLGLPGSQRVGVCL